MDVRVVVATHRNLEEQVRQGTFREDLYHRVFVFPIVLPPLRERREDIRVLAEHFVRQLEEQNNWKLRKFSSRCDCGIGALFVAGECAGIAECGGTCVVAGTGDVVEAETVRRALPARWVLLLVVGGRNGFGEIALEMGALRSVWRLSSGRLCWRN